MSDMEIKELIEREIPGVSLKSGEPMRRHTSLRIGGPADVFISAEDADTAVRVLGVSRRSGFPYLPVGGGTNLLVRDKGIEGAVLSLAPLRTLETVREDGEHVVLSVGAGLPLQELVAYTKRTGLSGIEGLSGIPGNVGGAIAGNAGSYGCEMKDVVLSITVADGEGRIREIRKEELLFGYRRAVLPAGAVILVAGMVFRKDSPEEVSMRVGKWLEEKKKTQPLGMRSAGCVFKNPPGQSAGMLIDKAGCKGMKVGDIEVSGVHAGFFVNRGGGTADEFLTLMEKVSAKVREAFGVTLEPEIRIVGRG